jgi:hypothetical protein
VLCLLIHRPNGLELGHLATRRLFGSWHSGSVVVVVVAAVVLMTLTLTGSRSRECFSGDRSPIHLRRREYEVTEPFEPEQ